MMPPATMSIGRFNMGTDRNVRGLTFVELKDGAWRQSPCTILFLACRTPSGVVNLSPWLKTEFDTAPQGRTPTDTWSESHLSLG